MAIAQNPKRKRPAVPSTKDERQAEAFILGAGHVANQPAPNEASDPTPKKVRENKKPIMVRVDPEMLKRIDRAAQRLGISRSAFIMSSTAEKLERME
jgi:hypothetical protein